MSEPENPNLDEFFIKAMNIFMDKYAPANEIADATDFFTTEEILKAIQQIYPGVTIPNEEFVTYLEENGYIYDAEPNKMGFNIKWLVIRKAE